jgi:dynein heavy chain
MNTVLDDNKKLCLNSGQIIQLTPRMTMMFEVEDLAVASPATVSRCGMIYLEPESLTLAPLVTSWFNTLPPKVSGSKYVMSTLTEMMDQLLEPGCYFLRRNLGEMVMTVDNNLAGSIMRLLDCYFVKYIESEIKKITPEQVADLEKQIKHIYFFCLIWSVGGTTNAPGREKFNKWCREQMQKHGLSGFPEDKQVYDCNITLRLVSGSLGSLPFQNSLLTPMSPTPKLWCPLRTPSV